MDLRDQSLQLTPAEQKKINGIAVAAGVISGLVVGTAVKKLLMARYAGPPPDISISSGSVHLVNADSDPATPDHRHFHSFERTGAFSRWRVEYSSDDSAPETLTLDFGYPGVLTLSSGRTLSLRTNHQPSSGHVSVRLKIRSDVEFTNAGTAGHWNSGTDESIAYFKFRDADGNPGRAAGTNPRFALYLR